MASLSIQSIDEQLAALLKQRTAAARKSVSQFVLDTLRQHLGLEKEKRFTAEHDDLDSLFGAWTSIQGSISAERRIAPELWQ